MQRQHNTKFSLCTQTLLGGVAGDETRGHVCMYVFRSTRRNNVDRIAKSKPHTLKLVLMFNAACMLSAEQNLAGV